jgi:magnesium chelatase family protein
MFVRVQSFAVEGIEAVPVAVEVDVSPGLPCFDIVGLPDAAVRESRERVRAAIRNGGWSFPAQRITVNLAPAHTRKGGAGFDLAIALGVLAAAGHLAAESFRGISVAGELALDGGLRPVRGALAMALTARSESCRALVVPAANAAEAALAGGVVLGAEHLAAVVDHFTGRAPLGQAVAAPARPGALDRTLPDLADVRGQLIARRALEVAAAGGHNLLMIGPPGAGKSLLARCLPSILPPLEHEEALEVSRIHSVAGLLAGGRLLTSRPFRSPHHCASRSAVLGGGQPLRPGEMTLAHRGVLFLDELPEFARPVLEGLRQPLEEGRVMLSRANAAAAFPARPMLVAAANPCPCGYLGDPTRACTCPGQAVALYRSRLSGPLLDRFDLQIWLEPVPYEQLVAAGAQFGQSGPESSAVVRSRVVLARRRQRVRLKETQSACNAQLTPAEVRRFCRLPAGGEPLMRQAMEHMGLSLRGHDRILKVARTIADLAGAEQIELPHLAEALQYRCLERR